MPQGYRGPRITAGVRPLRIKLMFSIANAMFFAHVLTTEQLPQQFTAWVIEAGLTLVTFQLVVNVVLLVAGAFILSAIILILAQILFPVATRLDIDPVGTGILMVKPGNRPDYPSGRAQAVRHLRRDRHGWGVVRTRLTETPWAGYVVARLTQWVAVSGVAIRLPNCSGSPVATARRSNRLCSR